MIHVLAVPCINRPDLLAACLASIDEPVERLIVIDNSGTGELGDVAASIRPNALIVDPPSNLGVAASWNFAIRTTPDAPWWCLVNADVTFAPGDLGRLAGEMTDEAEVRCLIEFGAFGITAAAIEAAGWFDEQFVPIYAEDADYEYRCSLAGVPIIAIPNTSSHVGSAAIRSGYAEANARTYPANLDYYQRKWGGPLRGGERFTSPFDRGGSVRDWSLDLSRLRSQAW
jgi:GT2 family glycosyltransferase